MFNQNVFAQWLFHTFIDQYQDQSWNLLQENTFHISNAIVIKAIDKYQLQNLVQETTFQILNATVTLK